MNSAEANIIIKPDTTGCNHYTVSEWFLSLSAMIWWINTHIVIWALPLWEWRQNPEIMNGIGWKNLSSSLLILHSKALHFPWASLSILKWNVIPTCLVGAWLLPCRISLLSRGLHCPQAAALATGSTAQSCSRLTASDSDMASPWSQPAGHNEFVPCLWRARLKTDAGAGHWRNPNMAKMPRCVRTGTKSKDGSYPADERSFLNF